MNIELCNSGRAHPDMNRNQDIIPRNHYLNKSINYFNEFLFILKM
jgi:hypothetical protein